MLPIFYMRKHYTTADVHIIKTESLYRGFLNVDKVSLQHRLFNQTTYSPVLQRELIVRKDAAGVLIYNHHRQQFALIEQFRVGAMAHQPWQLEVIAGVIDDNENPETCIKRESLEEAGCHISNIEHLFTFYPSAGACSERFYLYAAQAELPQNGSLFGLKEEGEDIKLHIFNYTDLPELLQHPQVCNSPVIIALQWLAQKIKMQGDL